MHKDSIQSNSENDTFVGLVDWEITGPLKGLKIAGKVHRRIRTPQREHFLNSNLHEKQLRDMMFCSDLDEEDMPEN
jgi:hypothetical protein